ncbi:MAG: hypothetical protein FRX49_07114 [Trebouxia sp. A1-2]|nr:MAG: hypothetical protein FRX49_07114 [Trebouxia sp. A1-2]
MPLLMSTSSPRWNAVNGADSPRRKACTYIQQFRGASSSYIERAGPQMSFSRDYENPWELIDRA